MSTLESTISSSRNRRPVLALPPALVRFRQRFLKPILFVISTLILLTAIWWFKVIPPTPPTEAQIQAAGDAIPPMGSFGGITFRHVQLALADATLFYLVPETASTVGRWMACWNTLHWTAWLLVALLGLVRLVFRFGSVPLAIARLTINDMLRQRLGLWPVSILVILLSLFPLLLTTAQPLRYQLQTYLQYSFMLTAGLLSVLTLLLATRSTSSDMSEGHVSSLFTKPLGRAMYLLGKFLGVAILNVVLVAVSAFAIYVTSVSITRGQPQSDDDYFDMRDQVLLARESYNPRPDRPFIESARERLAVLEKEGSVIISPGPNQQMEREARALELAGTQAREWRSIAPGAARTFLFDGLLKVKTGSEDVQLRLKGQVPTDPPDKIYPIIIDINGRMGGMNLRVGSHQVFPLPPDAINEKGELRVTIINRSPVDPNSPAGRMSISFADENTLQVMYPVARFEDNFWRPVVVMLSRLIFLSMLGVIVGTLLSFPVAAQLAMTVWILAAGASYIADALDYTPTEGRPLDPNVIYSNTMVPLIRSATAILGQFSTPDAAGLLADGRFITGVSVWNHLGIIAVLWSVLLLLVGWVFFRGKELARVTV